MTAPSNYSDDDEVLANLSKNGDRSAIPRPVDVWIYGSETDIKLVASRLQIAGWALDGPRENADGGSEKREPWLVKATRTQTTDQAAIHGMSDEIRTFLAGTTADYDGWETSVERGN